MDNGRVDEIRARWEAVQHPVVQGLKMPPMAAHEAFVDNADDDIAYLLAEREADKTLIDSLIKRCDEYERIAQMNADIADHHKAEADKLRGTSATE